MKKEEINELLIAKKRRVYTIIIFIYSEKIQLLKSKLFCEWLASELGLRKEDVNYHSLNSALYRNRKRKAVLANSIPRKNQPMGYNPDLPDTSDLRNKNK
jgi:hypothetical protein